MTSPGADPRRDPGSGPAPGDWHERTGFSAAPLNRREMDATQIERRDYTYCTAVWHNPYRREEFVTGTPILADAQTRALTYATRQWGEPDELMLETANKIVQARKMFTAGRHDGAGYESTAASPRKKYHPRGDPRTRPRVPLPDLPHRQHAQDLCHTRNVSGKPRRSRSATAPVSCSPPGSTLNRTPSMTCFFTAWPKHKVIDGFRTTPLNAPGAP